MLRDCISKADRYMFETKADRELKDTEKEEKERKLVSVTGTLCCSKKFVKSLT